MKKPLQVSLHVQEPSVVELTVADTVQLDRLTPSPQGYVAARRGELLIPGSTTLQLEQGIYFFKTLSEAHLKVISGGVDASVDRDDKDSWPDPKPKLNADPSPPSKGHEPGGEAPRFTVDHGEARAQTRHPT